MVIVGLKECELCSTDTTTMLEWIAKHENSITIDTMISEQEF